MGWDISYHPIKEQEVKTCYFDVLKNDTLIDQIGKEYGTHEFYIDKYKQVIAAAKNIDPTLPFDKTHGYYLAVIQGLLRKYFYVRGGAFSFVAQKDNSFFKYCRKWGDVIPKDFQIGVVRNQLTENYSSGGLHFS